MGRLDALIFGYRILRIRESELPKFSSRLLRLGIPARLEGGAFIIRERDIKQVEALLQSIDHEISEPLGVFGKYKKMKCKMAVLLGTMVCFALALLSSNLVWDVRIEGNSEIPASKIVNTLSECGISVGDFWSSIDRSAVETELLRVSPDIAWVNINRRGSVAYVKIVENENKMQDNSEQSAGYSNIVAESDCVIEEITVSSGYPVVKVGDVVKKGDLLISGVLPAELGGGFCKADGVVIGRVSDSVTVSVNSEHIEKSVKKEEIISLNFKIFKFNANIFKKYGNSAEECDIIKEIKTFSFFGKCILPFEILSVYALEYEEEQKIYTPSELVSVAKARLDSATVSKLAGKDLIKIKTTGEFIDGGYRMVNDIVFLANVAQSLPFAAG